MNLKQINFKQPKYIFPLIVAVPMGCLLYLFGEISTAFGSKEEESSDFINTELPEPELSKERTKEQLMDERFDWDDENFGAIEEIGKEKNEREMIGDDYTDEEVERIMNETEDQRLLNEQVEEAQRKLDSTQRNLLRRNQDQYEVDNRPPADPYEELREIQKRRRAEVESIIKAPDEQIEQEKERERLAKIEQERKEKEEAPMEVIKADNLSHSMFNTVSSSDNGSLDAPLIKAMIDQTTKSTEGTRLRFKLLDDIIIDDVLLKKGTYLYGVVSGFGQQRVKANIPSILVGERFLKVSLNVYDLDGMEGFYVPESSFRVFLQNAASSVAGQNIQFSNNNSIGSGFDAENVALQAIQNVYQAAAGAISGNLKKNKAKIKYNTIVYLINSNNK